MQMGGGEVRAKLIRVPFFLSTDKISGVTTLTFHQKRLEARNARELQELIGVIEVLNRTMKELLQSYYGEVP
jgi:hypothetical protein